MAHSLHGLEAALFAPAFAVMIAAYVRDRRRRARDSGGQGQLHTSTKD